MPKEALTPSSIVGLAMHLNGGEQSMKLALESSPTTPPLARMLVSI